MQPWKKKIQEIDPYRTRHMIKKDIKLHLQADTNTVKEAPHVTMNCI